MNFKHIKLEIANKIATLWFSRPLIHNAFNEEMISDILEAVNQVNENIQAGILILRGEGKSFCAGADLNWMRAVANYSYEQNFEESLQLSKCFYALYTCKKPTIAMVHGAAIGGANGLIAACDMAYAEENTVFSLSEVKIGIVPACISPYLIKRVGEYNAKELMLRGKRFDGQEAVRKGLINMAGSKSEIEQELSVVIEQLKTSGPQAMTHCKNLIYDVTNKLTINEAIDYTANIIAQIRASDEGQEGMAAFLEKRKPNWVE